MSRINKKKPQNTECSCWFGELSGRMTETPFELECNPLLIHSKKLPNIRKNQLFSLLPLLHSYLLTSFLDFELYIKISFCLEEVFLLSCFPHVFFFADSPLIVA